MKDASGVSVGRVIGMQGLLLKHMPIILTDQGYITYTDIITGRVEYPSSGIYYESLDCTGTAYVEPSIDPRGTVFMHGTSSEAAYAAGLILYTPMMSLEIRSISIRV